MNCAITISDSNEHENSNQNTTSAINEQNSNHLISSDSQIQQKTGPNPIENYTEAFLAMEKRKLRPEVGAARENEAVEVVGGAHGVNDDVGEGAGVEAFDLDVVAEGGEITIQGSKLAAAPVVVRVLRGRNRHFHLRRSVRPIALRILPFHLYMHL